MTSIGWLDLWCGDDPHAHRFDRIELLRAHLRRIERLSEEAITQLELSGEVEPPLARRAYRLRRPQDPA